MKTKRKRSIQMTISAVQVPFHLMNNSKTLTGFSLCAGKRLKSQILRVLSCFPLGEKGQSEEMKA